MVHRSSLTSAINLAPQIFKSFCSRFSSHNATLSFLPSAGTGKWDLPKNDANYTELSPISWLRRAERVHADEPSIIHGSKAFTWKETAHRCNQLANALASAGVRPGDTVSVVASNTPEMNELHFGVAMAGAVLNCINTRLDPATIAFILDHGESSFLVTDTEFAPTVREALKKRQGKRKITVIDIRDSEAPDFLKDDLRLGECDYEEFIGQGSSQCASRYPLDEWDAISLSYTSGTTGDPKGVVTHHRGAYLNAMSNAVGWQLGSQVRYLWTLPMFHCNGCCFPWTIAAVGGTSICLRKVSAKNIYSSIADHGATHLCAAPIVLNTLVNATPEEQRHFDHKVKVMTAAAPPPPATLQAMQAQGFEVAHVYGLTETYGPAALCQWKPEWDRLPAEEQAALRARQGVGYHALEDVQVMDPDSTEPVPADGKTIGEVFFRGNIVMKGYLKNEKATAKDFQGGWLHSGDLGVMHSDGYIELKDRAKDVIISGGENISSVEIENVLAAHPGVLHCAVVAKPDVKYGERPCAFVELHPSCASNLKPSAAGLVEHCREHLAKFKLPTHFVFQEIPKTSTGKVQKFRLREYAASIDAMESQRQDLPLAAGLATLKSELASVVSVQ